MSPWVEKYVGIPFEYGARNIRSADCWGLVRMVFSDALGVDLPLYGEVSASNLREVARKMAGEKDTQPWQMVIDPQEFDVAVMGLYNRRVPAHVGIMIDDHHLLHTEESSHSCIVRLTHPTVRERVLGFRRHITLI